MIERRYHEGLKEIYETESWETVNKMLPAGYELISVRTRSVATTDPEGKFVASVVPCYILGRYEAEAGPKLLPAATPQQNATQAAPATKTPEPSIEARLEALLWTAAQSRKCDYVYDAPADLVRAVRESKGGVEGTAHRFTASKTEATLFRFKRSAKA